MQSSLWCLGAYLTLPEYTTSEIVELVDASQLGRIENLAQIVIDEGFKIPLRYLHDVTVELNHYVMGLEGRLQENQEIPQGLEHGTIILNTALVHRERGVFEPESVTYDNGLKSYVVTGKTTTREGAREELLYCHDFPYLHKMGFADEHRTQLAHDHRIQGDRQIGWSEESKKVLDACGPRVIAFITPSAGDIYKLMKAAVPPEDIEGGKLFQLLNRHFLEGWTITSDRVRYMPQEENDIFTYNVGLGPEHERRIYTHIRGQSGQISGDYAHATEHALQDIFDTNDGIYKIRKTLEPYIPEEILRRRHFGVPYSCRKTEEAGLHRSNQAGERVLSLGNTASHGFGGFKVNADFPVDNHGRSLRVARVRDVQM
ncbi:MAG: hypothetical protein AABX47_00440 [Nanoarchaeota archaeon]